MVQLHLNVCIDIFEIRISRLVSENGFKNLINLTYSPIGQFFDNLAFGTRHRRKIYLPVKILTDKSKRKLVIVVVKLLSK